MCAVLGIHRAARQRGLLMMLRAAHAGTRAESGTVAADLLVCCCCGALNCTWGLAWAASSASRGINIMMTWEGSNADERMRGCSRCSRGSVAAEARRGWFEHANTTAVRMPRSSSNRINFQSLQRGLCAESGRSRTYRSSTKCSPRCHSNGWRSLALFIKSQQNTHATAANCIKRQQPQHRQQPAPATTRPPPPDVA